MSDAPDSLHLRAIERLAAVVVGRPRTVVAASVLLCMLLTVFAARIRFETAPDIWFLPDDPTLGAHHELKERFGSDRWVVVGLSAPDEGVFSNPALEAIERLTRGIETAPHVRRVRSLTRFDSVVGADDVLEIVDLIDEDALPLTSDALARARSVILRDPLAVGLLVSPDGTGTAIVAEMEVEADSLEHTLALIDRLYEIVEEERARSGFELQVAGGPVIEWAFFTSSVADNQKLVPALYGFIALVLFGVLRRLLGVFYALAVIALATGATLGAFGLMGLKFNNLTSMLPMILLAVAVANGVHVLVAFYDGLRRGLDRTAAARASIRELATPCFLSSVTTAIGFASLTTSAMPPLRVFGGFAAFGVLASFAICMTFLPAVLCLGRRPTAARSAARPPSSNRLITAALSGMGSAASRHPWPVVAVGIAFTVTALVGTTRIRVESDALEYFRPGHIARHGIERVQEFMGGVANFEIVVRTPEAGAVKEPELLRMIEDLETYLMDVPEVTKTISIAGFVKRLNRSLDEDHREAAVVPDTREGVAQVLLLYEMADPEEDLSGMVDPDYQHTRVTARLPFRSSQRTTEIVTDLRAYLDERFVDPVSAEVTGLKVLYNQMQNYVFETFVKSFGIALAIITVIIALALRSVPLGIVSMVPNVLPILWVLGVMGFTGIPLNVGTALVAGVTLGIAVDDTIHFLARYAKARRGGAATHEAIRYVFEHSGPAILTTSVILVGGFWTLVFAQFLPMSYLGLITGITILFALMADLVLLPALLTLRAKREAVPVTQPATEP